MADPRIVDSIDVTSGLDRPPNLIDLTAQEFEHFVQNLFTLMGFETHKLKNSGAEGRPHPKRGGAAERAPATHVVVTEGTQRGVAADDIGDGARIWQLRAGTLS